MAAGGRGTDPDPPQPQPPEGHSTRSPPERSSPKHPNAIRLRVESTLTSAGRRLKIALEIDGVEANLVRVAKGTASEVLPHRAITTPAGNWLATAASPPRGRSAAQALTGAPHLTSPSARARHAIRPGIPSVPHPPETVKPSLAKGLRGLRAPPPTQDFGILGAAFSRQIKGLSHLAEVFSLIFQPKNTTTCSRKKSFEALLIFLTICF